MSDFLQPRGMQSARLSLSFAISWSLLKLMSFELVKPSNHLVLSLPFLLLPSIFPSIRVFPNTSAPHIRWPTYWSFTISTSNEYSGLTSFSMDWFDLLAIQGTLKSLLQHHSSKASILWCLAFFMVQLSQLYMTTGKTIALTRWTFIGKVMSLLFNGFPGSSAGKESTCNAGDLGSVPGLERSPEEGKAYQLQYSGLKNSMNCIVYGVAKSQT